MPKYHFPCGCVTDDPLTYHWDSEAKKTRLGALCPTHKTRYTHKTYQCTRCGDEFDSRAHSAKYCPACRHGAYRELGRDWASKNPHRYKQDSRDEVFWHRGIPEPTPKKKESVFYPGFIGMEFPTTFSDADIAEMRGWG